MRTPRCTRTVVRDGTAVIAHVEGSPAGPDAVGLGVGDAVGEAAGVAAADAGGVAAGRPAGRATGAACGRVVGDATGPAPAGCDAVDAVPEGTDGTGVAVDRCCGTAGLPAM